MQHSAPLLIIVSLHHLSRPVIVLCPSSNPSHIFNTRVTSFMKKIELSFNQLSIRHVTCHVTVLLLGLSIYISAELSIIILIIIRISLFSNDFFV